MTAAAVGNDSVSARPAVGESASEGAYRQIKRWLLDGDLPLGVRLGEERIAERLAVSRTPVREALLTLHAERFLERHPDGGFRVNHPTARSVRNLYEVRKALELHAVRLVAAEPAGLDELRALRSEWAAIDAGLHDGDPEFVLVDEDFHRRLVAAAGNSELVEALRVVAERIRPVRTHDFRLPGRILATVAEHLAVLDALRDGGDAEGMLARHIDDSLVNVEAAVGAVLERLLASTLEGVE